MFHYPAYKDDDRARILEAIQAFPLGLVVSCLDGAFAASHIPFMVDVGPAGELRLLGHLDAENPQARILDGATVYVVFQGPNSYVSPHVYVTKQLPTWNYLAVHATGRCHIETPGLPILDDLERLAVELEPGAGGWRIDKSAPLVQKLAPLICRLTIAVEQIEGRFKVSQEKCAADRQAATTHLLAQTPAESHGCVRHLSLKGRDPNEP